MTRNKSERELEQQQKILEYCHKELRVFIADIIPNEYSRADMNDRMEEIENLVKTFGGVVVLKHIQKKGKPDYNSYIGGGKLDEIIAEMKEENANLLILGNTLRSHQIYKVNEKLKEIGAKAWDRVDLILKIFERNAKSSEARIQIELASIKHMGPRIFDMGMELGKQGAGAGSKGKGETNTEIMKRHLQARTLQIKADLEKFKKVRKEHRKSRERKGYFTVGIVGYTNAGKSSLLNSLTKKGVLSENKLFATLGTSVGKLFIPTEKVEERIISKFRNIGKMGIELLLNDTIGFIRDLPPDLVQAFASTLEDSIESDLLLHIVDASDKDIVEKIKVVDDILGSIGANQKKLYVFNKIDLISQEKQQNLEKLFQDYHPIFVSSFKQKGFENMIQHILSAL